MPKLECLRSIKLHIKHHTPHARHKLYSVLWFLHRNVFAIYENAEDRYKVIFIRFW